MENKQQNANPCIGSRPEGRQLAGSELAGCGSTCARLGIERTLEFFSWDCTSGPLKCLDSGLHRSLTSFLSRTALSCLSSRDLDGSRIKVTRLSPTPSLTSPAETAASAALRASGSCWIDPSICWARVSRLFEFIQKRAKKAPCFAGRPISRSVGLKAAAGQILSLPLTRRGAAIVPACCGKTFQGLLCQILQGLRFFLRT